MSIGTGIFLASLCLSAVILYAQTKDRWNWRRLIRRFLLGLVAVVFVGGLVLGIAYFAPLVRERWAPVTELNGFRLGESLSEAQFKSGSLSRSGRTDAANGWQYASGTDRVSVAGNVIKGVGHRCWDDSSSDPTEVKGISCTANGDTIEQKFGGRLRVLCEKPQYPSDRDAVLVRYYDLLGLGVRFVLVRNRIGIIVIAAPAKLETWVKGTEPCK